LGEERGKKAYHSLKGSYVSPARPSERSSLKNESENEKEDVRMVTAAV
jgi:hypothetical protein